MSQSKNHKILTQIAKLAERACNACCTEYKLKSGITVWLDTCDVCLTKEMVRSVNSSKSTRSSNGTS